MLGRRTKPARRTAAVELIPVSAVRALRPTVFTAVSNLLRADVAWALDAAVARDGVALRVGVAADTPVVAVFDVPTTRETTADRDAVAVDAVPVGAVEFAEFVASEPRDVTRVAVFDVVAPVLSLPVFVPGITREIVVASPAANAGAAKNNAKKHVANFFISCVILYHNNRAR